MEPPRVTCSVGYTRNMGDFESLRIDFGVEDSTRPGEKVSEATERIYNFVSGKLIDKIKEIEQDIKKVKN